MTQSQHVDRTTLQLSQCLGWFSIALGAAELIAPAAVARAAGIRRNNNTDSVVRTFGAREISSGLAILADPANAPRVWSRVAGDAIDLSVLASAFREDGADTGRVGLAAAIVAGVTL